MDKEIFCGCSGYNYDDWKGEFYPDDMGQEDWFSFYTKKFDTVEINNTFYNLPGKETVESWLEDSPADFKFSIKASRYITHMKKLKMDDDLREAVEGFYESIHSLSDKISCILWQLPGNLHKDTGKLKEFLPLTDDSFHNVFEFRHTSWFSDDVFSILEEAGAACCSLSCPEDELCGELFTISDTVYIRMHGREEWYKGSYKKEELNNWLRKLKESEFKEAYIYFNNSVDAFAPKDCMDLEKLIQQKP